MKDSYVPLARLGRCGAMGMRDLGDLLVVAPAAEVICER
jgi:hypothetical protein